MALPIPKSYEPMSALLVDDIPAGSEWRYEPKWDGFRCIAFRDGKSIELMSRSGKPLTRYFPDVVDVLSKLAAEKFVLDGEIVVPVGNVLSFDDLLQRIHPAASRINKLSVERPATFIVFDLLVDLSGKSIVDRSLDDRRAALDSFMKKFGAGHERLVLSPQTADRKRAIKWLAGVGATTDGVMAKRATLPYQTGTRDGMVKVKRMRTADCVIGGFRYASSGKASVGSLLLGLFNDQEKLDHIGFCSSFTAVERKELKKKLEPHIGPPGFTGNAPGGPSRWSTDRSTKWEPLDNQLVVEIRYDHFGNGRFRHGTTLLRWRPDKAAKQCTMRQIEQEAAATPVRLAKSATVRSSKVKKRK